MEFEVALERRPTSDAEFRAFQIELGNAVQSLRGNLAWQHIVRSVYGAREMAWKNVDETNVKATKALLQFIEQLLKAPDKLEREGKASRVVYGEGMREASESKEIPR